MKKISTLYLKIFSIISFISFLWIFIIVVYRTFMLSRVSIIIMLGICVVIFLFGRKIYEHINENEIRKIWISLWGIAAIFMIYIAWNLRASVHSTWDYGRILNDAIELAQTNDFESQAYYARYPNNLLLLFIL